MRFIIVSNEFEKPLYAASNEVGWSDDRAQAYEYDRMDEPSRKLGYWQAHAKMRRLNPELVVVQEIA